MTFEITQVGERIFLIKAPSGQFIRPATTHDLVVQLQQEFLIDPNGIRFFWPDDNEIDMIVAILWDRPVRRPK